MRAILCCALAVMTVTGRAQESSEKGKSRVDTGRNFLGLEAPPDPAAAARGQKVYAQACSFCHGPNANGAEGPNLLRSAVVLHDDKGEKIGPFLRQGRPEKGMPAFPGMDDAQTRDIAAFLHLRVEQASNRFGYKLLNVVTGDPQAGQAYFAAHCQSCHSPAGDLAHIGKTDPADLQAIFLYPDAKHSPVQVTGAFANGDIAKGTLKQMDDFTVSIRDSDGAVRSWPRSAAQWRFDDPLSRHRELLAQYSDADMHNILAYLVTFK